MAAFVSGFGWFLARVFGPFLFLGGVSPFLAVLSCALASSL